MANITIFKEGHVMMTIDMPPSSAMPDINSVPRVYTYEESRRKDNELRDWLKAQSHD